jgi:antitoxin component YwqK of YwqJK toxin-antitoxin module
MFCPAITITNSICNIETKNSEKYCQTHKKLLEYSSVDSDNLNENTFILDRSASKFIYYKIESSNIQYTYHANGNVKTKYVSNDKYLQKFLYFENSKLYKLDNFILDPERKLHGYQYRYYMNGQMDYKEYYLNGLSEGKQYSWHYDGKLMNFINYKNGINHGTQLSWYDNSNLYFHYNYIDGEKVGLQQTYGYYGELEHEAYHL